MLTRRMVGAQLAALVLAVGMVGSAFQTAATVPIDVMTFNIRTASVPDGENSWRHRKDVVVETISRATPHVVGLQEVVSEQIDYLEARLPEYRWVGIDRGLNGGEGLSEYTPLFYRFRELSPIESGNFWLTETPDSPPAFREVRGRRRRFGRIATWARFHHIESGRELYVYNTHLTIRQGERQIASVNLIADRIASLPTGSAVVVTGDFNAPAGDSETWRVATRRGLRDAWVVADERHGPAFTLSAFGPPVDWHVGRIDWVLVRGPIRVYSVETVLHNDEGRYPSDHYPVAARLALE